MAACGLFLLGSLRYTLSLPDLSDPGHIAAYTDRGSVTVCRRVAAEPDVRDTHTNLRLAVDRVQVEEEEHPIKGNILAGAPRYPVYMYGDELEVQGKLEIPPVFEGSSYRDHPAPRGMFGMVGWPEIRLLSRGGGSPVYRLFLFVKTQIQATIARILPEPEASLLTGILLGVESGIPERVKDGSAVWWDAQRLRAVVLGQPRTSIAHIVTVGSPGRLQRVAGRPERHSGLPVTPSVRS